MLLFVARIIKQQSSQFSWLEFLSRASIPAGATAFSCGLAILCVFCLWTASLLATHTGPPAVVVHEARPPKQKRALFKALFFKACFKACLK